jgi:hypothetical protein
MNLNSMFPFDIQDGSMRNGEPDYSKTSLRCCVVKSFVLRCEHLIATGTTKCMAWGEDQLRLCYSEFHKHCIERHDLQEWDTTSQMHLELENWMLTLIKT